MCSLKKIAICSRSFSRNKTLRAEILSKYDNVIFNDKGLALNGAGLVDFLHDATHVISALEMIDDEVLSQLRERTLIALYFYPQ